jgi:hypothetical protein
LKLTYKSVEKEEYADIASQREEPIGCKVLQVRCFGR